LAYHSSLGLPEALQLGLLLSFIHTYTLNRGSHEAEATSCLFWERGGTEEKESPWKTVEYKGTPLNLVFSHKIVVEEHGEVLLHGCTAPGRMFSLQTCKEVALEVGRLQRHC